MLVTKTELCGYKSKTKFIKKTKKIKKAQKNFEAIMKIVKSICQTNGKLWE